MNLNVKFDAPVVTEFLKRISDGIGGLVEPWQITRRARAEAEAEIIHALKRAEISEIEKRSLLRMIHEEGKKQENIEAITGKAIPHLTTDATPNGMESDWIAHFFDRCRLVSDAEMQSLWARILADEANKPGSFSKKTIDCIEHFEKNDANLFTLFCTFVWSINGRIAPVFCRDYVDHENGLEFEQLQHLGDMGLINFSTLGNVYEGKFAGHVSVSYYGYWVDIELPKNIDELFVGCVRLTQAGKQLFRISGAKKSDAYFSDALSMWLDKNYLLSSPLINT